jgi:MFS transporter, DHA1 family, inner membrane transport protein
LPDHAITTHIRVFAMAFFSNPGINRLAAHFSVHQFAWSISGAFFATFLLRNGMSPAGVLLCIAAVLGLRFALRPCVLVTAARIGLRNSLIIGTLLYACQILALAIAGGSQAGLVFYIAISALGDVFYWTCYHAFFAALGDAQNRGAQLGARGLFATLASALGPGIGGVLLANFGAWTAFSAGAAIELVAIAPLLRIAEPVVILQPWRQAFSAAREGVILFSTDGFITCAMVFSWDMASFLAFDQRFDILGAVLSAAAVAGAIGGMVFGGFIDAGHTGRAVGLNAWVLAGLVVLKALCIGSPVAMMAATVVGNVLGGLYLPTLMTAVYNEAKASPCALRFHFATEGGWDAGGMVACLIAAAAWGAGVPPAFVLLLSLLGITAQARLLWRRYDAHALAPSSN